MWSISANFLHHSGQKHGPKVVNHQDISSASYEEDNTSEPSASFSFLIGGNAGLSGAPTPDTTESTSDTPVSDSVSITAS